MTTFPLLLMRRDRFVFPAWIVTYPKAVVLSKSLATEKRKVLVKVFFSHWFLGKKSDIVRPRKSKIWKKERKKRKKPRYGKHICQFLGPIEYFHMTSRRPYWCPKTMKRRPCWSSKPVLWELSSFLMQTLSFVSINLLRYCMATWVKTLYTGQLFVPTRNEWMIKHYTLNVRCRGKQFCLPESPDVFRDEAEENIRTRGKTKLTGFPRDLWH